ncbi:MAG: PqqD family protein [Elusimicrobia bacterium]|nr:PqqD family protein [Elusimicrobiota bacterium]
MKSKIKKELAFRRIAGEVFIVDAARSELHELNGPAALIWEGLAAGRTEKAIVSAITAEFEVDERTARADLEGFIKELLKAGLLCR